MCVVCMHVVSVGVCMYYVCMDVCVCVCRSVFSCRKNTEGLESFLKCVMS